METSDQEAHTVAQELVEQFVAKFGAPMMIHTDQGRNEIQIFHIQDKFVQCRYQSCAL